MNLNLTKILQSKREFRQRLAALPIEEKLAMLDVLRERTVAIRSAMLKTQWHMLQEHLSYSVGKNSSQ